jgi:hypothetical protein
MHDKSLERPDKALDHTLTERLHRYRPRVACLGRSLGGEATSGHEVTSVLSWKDFAKLLDALCSKVVEAASL